MKMATDVYTLDFDPTKLSHQEEKLGLEFADNDTAIELMKKEENITELNGKIYSDNKFKDFFDRYEKTLKARNQSKIRFETFKAFRNDLRTKVVNERELAKNL
jgi:hypothetical protein